MDEKRPSAVVRAARWSARHPWKSIAAWLALVVACVAVGGMIGTKQLDGSQEGNGESARAERIIEQSDLRDPESEVAFIRNRAGGGAGPQATAAAAQIARRIATVPEVGPVEEPVISKDGTAVLVSWRVRSTETEALRPMEEVVRAVASQNPALRIDQIGALSVEKAIEESMGKDFVKAEQLSLPITLAILLVAFGALIAAAIPVLLAMSCVAMAIGVTAVASHVAPVSDAVTSVILLIGLAVGVDYSMFFLRRVRDERAKGAATRDAVDIAAATAGRAVVVSGVTVMIAMAGMFLSGNTIFTSFAIGTVVVVAAAVVGSVTVLPALAARLGTWVDRPRVPFIHRLGRSGRPGVWHAILRPVMRRPAVALVGGLVALGALALPAVDLNPKLVGIEDLPRSLPVMQAYDDMTAAFPAEGSAHVVVVKGADLRAAEVTAAVDRLWARAGASGRFALDATPNLEVSRDGTVARLAMPFVGGDDGPNAHAGLTLLRDTLLPETVGRVASASVTGNPAVNRDFTEQLSSRLPLVFAFVLALTFLLMLMSFRSLPIAALTVGLNLLSVAAAYGLLVAVFQHSWAEGILGFESNGGIVAWLPLFLFVVLFGLSMDYHVFVLSRVREGIDAGLNHGAAIRWGVVSSAGVVTSAAVVMVAVFSVFATLSALDFKQMGVGLASAVLIDATVVRGVLLPASLRLLGERAWYMPSWLRWVPHLAHGAAAPSRSVEPVAG